MIIEIGDAASTIDNTPISADSRRIYIGGSTYEIPSLLTIHGLPASIVNDQRMEAVGAGAILFGGQTISEGQDMTVAGYPVSNGHNQMVIGGTTFEKPPYGKPVSTAAPNSLPSVIGTKPLIFNEDGALMVDGKSMYPGQQTTMDGKRVSIETGEVVVDSTTYIVPVSLHAAAAESTGKITQINNEVLTFDTDGRYVFDGSIMSPGEQTTVQGMYISVGQAWAVAGGHTYSTLLSSNALERSGATQPSSVDDPVVPLSTTASTIPGETVPEADNSPSTSVSGQNDSNDEKGLGAVIMSAFGNMPSQTTTTEASPTAVLKGSSPSPTPSGITLSQSNDLRNTASRSLWITLIMTVLVLLLQPL